MKLWFAATLVSSWWVSGHPGESEKRAESLARAHYLASLEYTDLAHCSAKLSSNGVVNRAVERRRKLAQRLVKRSDEGAGLQKRQNFVFDKVLHTNHKFNFHLSSNSPPDWAWLGQNKSIALHPQTTEGPFYVTGEFIRKDITDSEKGVAVDLDIQVIDINTCEPIPKAAVEIWGANATGVYSGVVHPLNGHTEDTENLQKKFLRGVQIADRDGAVQFKTILPGHYVGRATHLHVVTHLNYKILPNNTLLGGRIPHIGQLFFDQDLLDEAYQLPPYKDNKSPATPNNQDFIMAFDTAGGFDPVVRYVWLGEKLDDGIFAWINFGVNGTYSRPSIRRGADCFDSGCKAQPIIPPKGDGLLPPGIGPITEMPKGLVMATDRPLAGLESLICKSLGTQCRGAAPTPTSSGL